MKTLVTYAKVRAVAESEYIDLLLPSLNELRWEYLGAEALPSESVLWFKLSDSTHGDDFPLMAMIYTLTLTLKRYRVI